MRILPFPTNVARRPAHQIADWSQQEVADFYRAHRLLAENGADIGIDRGISDIGEPWLVFFDVTSQDVFLHIARIDDCCHLICGPLNLRLTAADITALIAKFESSVRSYFSVRADQASNVVIHPAARIIMSISAIFLLFKLDSKEAQAKGLSEKTTIEVGDTSGPARIIDKTGTPFARAQAAFARAFDAVDAPANAAILAGVMLAGELALSSDVNSTNSGDTAKAALLPHHAEAPVLAFLESDESHKVATEETVVAKHVSVSNETPPLADSLQGEHSDPQKAPSLMPSQIILKQVQTPPDEVAIAHNTVGSEANEVVSTVAIAQTVRATDSQSDAGNKPTALTGDLVKVGDDATTVSKPSASMAPASSTQPPTQPTTPPDAKVIVSLATLDSITSKAGFNLTTNYDDSKFYALKEYLTKEMGDQVTFEYQSDGKLLIEQVGIEALKVSDIGVWTNVAADNSTTSIVGKADVIDHVMTFFS